MKYKADVDKDGVIHSIIEIWEEGDTVMDHDNIEELRRSEKMEYVAMKGRFIKDITEADVANYNKWEYTKYAIKESLVDGKTVKEVKGKEEFKIDTETIKEKV